VLITGFSGSAAGFWFGFDGVVVLAGFHISFYILSILMVMRSQLLFARCSAHLRAKTARKWDPVNTYWPLGDNQVRRRHVNNQTLGYHAKLQKLWFGRAFTQCLDHIRLPGHCLTGVNIPPLLAFLISGKPLRRKILFALG
jgi:hypothetical protein